jgi:hypothetical protein
MLGSCGCCVTIEGLFASELRNSLRTRARSGDDARCGVRCGVGWLCSRLKPIHSAKLHGRLTAKTNSRSYDYEPDEWRALRSNGDIAMLPQHQ